MKVCPNCNQSVEENVAFCSNCGSNLSADTPYNQTNHQAPPVYYAQPVQQKHDVPKCTSCGHVGPWKLGPILRPMDFVIGLIFLVLGVVPGIIYLVTVAIIRSNKDRREKICPQCKAKNLWTFIY